MNILHISQSCNPKHGGPFEAIRQQALAHKEYGDCVHVASLDCPSEGYLKYSELTIIPCKKFWYDYIFPFSLYKWLRVNYSRYDAVIVDGIWGFHLLATWLVIRFTNTPYFVFPHGMLDPWFRKQFPLKHIKKVIMWSWAVYPVLRDADAVLFTCEQERRLACQSFKPYVCTEKVVNFGTAGLPSSASELSQRFLATHPFLLGKQLFLFLGRVHPKKAPDLILRAISRLQNAHVWDNRTMVLVIAGPSDGKYANSLINLASDLDISDSIYWTGMISGDDKWGAFQASDVFILPSHQENFGIAVAEALSCSKPVLLSHAVNISEQILLDGSGYVEADTLDGVTKLLQKWISTDLHSRRVMSLSAASTFSSRFHIDKCVRSIAECIHASIKDKLA